MRRNINKIIAFAIGVSIMSGSTISAFAADTVQQTASTTVTSGQTINGKPILTLDEAVKAAISISDTLELDEKTISYTDKINDLNKTQDDAINASEDKEDYDNDKADANLNKAKQQRDFDEDSLIQKVTDQYNSIVTNQMLIDMSTKSLQIENSKLKDAKLKQSLGIQTSIDVKTSELQIEKDKDTLSTSQNKLKDAEYTFKVLTGKDVTQYSLEQDIKFEPLKIDGSIDEYLDNTIDSDLKYMDEIVKLDKNYYDKDYEDDNKLSADDIDKAKQAIDDAENKLDADKKTNASNTGGTAIDLGADTQKVSDAQNAYKGKIANRLTYLNNKLANYKSEEQQNTTRKQLKDTLKSDYTNLQTAQSNIDYCKKEIELKNEQLKNYKLKYDLGMMTETDYNTQVVNTLQADIDLRNAIISYNQNKEYIQKPWILSSGAQGGK